MKKSLIALAALAAVGAATAQSSVTLYGIVDTYLANTTSENKGNAKIASVSTTSLDSSAVNGSRWGLRGSEDLGGGLKANFQLENGFSSDTGAAGQGGLLFGRHAWVGFSGNFGNVKLGRTATPFDDVNGNATPVFYSKLSPSVNIFRSAKYVVRASNTAKYETPVFNGFTGAVSYSLDERTGWPGAPAARSADAAIGISVKSFNVAYAAGPFSASLAAQSETDYPTAGVAAKFDINYTRLNVAYDFGTFIVKGNYGRAGNIVSSTTGLGISDANATEYEFGVDYKASSALTLSGGVARSNDNQTAGDASRTGVGVGASYTLSKRTFLYGGYETDTGTRGNAPDAKHSVVAAGVQHRF